MDMLDKLETGPRDKARASVIWLHGLGADGSDFEPIVPQLGLPDDVRFVFPHAPVRPVTINGGMPMRAWYDISMSGSGFVEDKAGIRDSQQHLERLIAAEIGLGVPPERIVLAGFSQGGAIVLHTGLRYRARLAGIMALSTYLPMGEKLADERSAAGKETPVFMAHGRFDQMVPMEIGVRSRDHLRKLGQPVAWHEYPIEHSVNLDEIRDIAAWLRQVLPIGIGS
jgi:phospholipase/carboxylesterase